MTVDWLKIKTEYISDTDTSYRKLSAKYGVSKSTLEKRARAEGWSEQRKEQCDKVATKVRQKTAEKISDALSEEAAAKVKIRTTLLKLVEDWIDAQIDGIRNTGDFRKIVQCCVDLGVMEEQGTTNPDDDGLLEALAESAKHLFDDEDDSYMLPLDELLEVKNYE